MARLSQPGRVWYVWIHTADYVSVVMSHVRTHRLGNDRLRLEEPGKGANLKARAWSNETKELIEAVEPHHVWAVGGDGAPGEIRFRLEMHGRRGLYRDHDDHEIPPVSSDPVITHSELRSIRCK